MTERRNKIEKKESTEKQKIRKEKTKEERVTKAAQHKRGDPSN